MGKLAFAIVAFACMVLVGSARAADEPTVAIRHLQTTTDLRVKALYDAIAAKEKLIVAQGQRISDLQTTVGWGAGLVTLLLGVAGFVGYRSARAEVKDVVVDWIKENREEIFVHFDARALREITPRIEVLEQDAQDRLDGLLGRVQRKKATISEDEKLAIVRAAKRAELKTDSEMRYGDWVVRAVKAEVNGQFEEAASAYGRASLANDASDQERARALVSRGYSLSGAGDYAGAIAAYEEVTSHFRGRQEVGIREQLAKALFNKGVVLRNTGDHGGAISAYDDVVSGFDAVESDALGEIVADSLYNKGFALEDVGDYKGAVAVFDELLSRFERKEGAVSPEQAADARNGKAFSLLLLAKERRRSAGREEEVRRLLTTALANVEAALRTKGADPIVLGNRGYILFLLGREEEARVSLHDALSLGGKDIRDGEVGDADIHALPEDGRFKALVEGLWEEVVAAGKVGGDG